MQRGNESGAAGRVRGILLAGGVAFVAVFSSQARGQEAGSAPPSAPVSTPVSAPGVPRPALMDLARQFVKTVGGGMAKADAAMGSEAVRKSAIAHLPEGTELILQARLERHVFPGDMIAVQRGGHLFVSLEDFFAVMGFPLRVDPDKKQAEGWFIRETKPFRLDGAAGRVQVGDKNFTIDPSRVEQTENGWNVAMDTLGAWMDMTFDVDVARQAPNVFRMKMLGATVVPVQSGAKTLKDAMNEALRDWVTNVDTTFYCIGTVAGPHPYPALVLSLIHI